ncbi:unnamed protein product [Bursaphelenchus okinawaensis]|uniref:Uncharacterized protein n=1 Tax=Bursaphelenchus okinawaensis TaxID=465554 RepID=A0A811JVP6_9BILA|nr:unnamed protein product [Bursaphelenchus okinawaensis]CAG9084755.1 unnamed protein product [Bursaphelenchus okinawaensis]
MVNMLKLVLLMLLVTLAACQWHGTCQTEKDCGNECAKYCGSPRYIQQCTDGNPGACDCLCQTPCMKIKTKSCQTVFIYYGKDRGH